VVPVYNGGLTISETIQSLLEQSYGPQEIIVVDDGSTDDTAAVLKGFGDKIKVISKSNSGPASARNCGIRASTGEFIAFTDSDCVPDKEWLSNLLGGFSDDKVAGTGGIVRGADTTALSDYMDLVRYLDPARTASGQVGYLATANACFRRNVLIEVGLFNEQFRKPGAEDSELCIKIRARGYELGAVDGALVLHYHKPTVKVFLKTMMNYGEGRYILEKAWPELAERDTYQPKRLLQQVLAVRNMFRQTLVYRPSYGIKKALLFSFLDHYGRAANIWGYLRSKKRDDRSSTDERPYSRP
jgi:glycosyltransferase involved in cell wall biosynthesis